MSTKIEAENIVQNLLNGVNEVTGNKDTNLTNAVNVLINSCDLSDIESLIGNCELVEPGEGSGGNSGGSAALNIHYGDTAPSDTSMLWCKCNEPNNVLITPNVVGGSEQLNLGIGSLPNSCMNMGVGVVGTKIYLFGGYNNGSYLNTINVFDTKTKTISTLSTTLPTACEYMGVGVVGNKIYLFGGYGGSYLTTICVFDTETETITTLSTPLPMKLCGMGVGVVGTNIYLFGGYWGYSWNEIYLFNTDTETIVKVGTLNNNCLYYMGIGVVGTKVYMFGGYRSDGYRNNNIYVFDSTTNAISYAGVSLSSNIAKMGVGVFGAKIYLFGGNGDTNLNTINVFDTETETITTLSTTLFTKDYGMGVGVVGATMYLFGGYGNGTVISEFTVGLSLEQNKMIIQSTLNKNIFNILDENVTLEMGVESVHIGNSEGYGEKVEAYLYQNDAWTQI